MDFDADTWNRKIVGRSCVEASPAQVYLIGSYVSGINTKGGVLTPFFIFSTIPPIALQKDFWYNW